MDYEPKKIAGHEFDWLGRCACGARIADLVSRRDEWKISALGIAHFGGLTEGEKAELEGWLVEVWEAVTALAA